MPDAEDVHLLARWTTLAGASAARYGSELIDRYREPHRRYHTTTHLTHVLDVIDLLDGDATIGIDATIAIVGRSEDAALATEEATSRRAAVHYAAWFHDAVYEIGDGHSAADSGLSNEERSAQLAERVLSAIGLPSAIVAEVARLVRCTAEHRVAPEDQNAALLCDADLAILGSEPRVYARYAEQIRGEYRAIPETQFRPGRAAILRGMLDRLPIYHTPRAHALFEARARQNIAAELEHLSPKR